MLATGNNLRFKANKIRNSLRKQSVDMAKNLKDDYIL